MTSRYEKILEFERRSPRPLSGELALEEVVDLPQDRIRNE
jgi:hypothetical protein